ncbi:16315_t:CDS:2, partial [Funneliformis mosseae]
MATTLGCPEFFKKPEELAKRTVDAGRKKDSTRRTILQGLSQNLQPGKISLNERQRKRRSGTILAHQKFSDSIVIKSIAGKRDGGKKLSNLGREANIGRWVLEAGKQEIMKKSKNFERNSFVCSKTTMDAQSRSSNEVLLLSKLLGQECCK